MQMKSFMIPRIAGICLALLVSVLFFTSVASAESEQITLGDYRTETPVFVVAGDTLQIPVNISGYPRGLNQYVVEFSVESPVVTVQDFTIGLDRTMIQHSVASDPAVDNDTVRKRYLQTVKMDVYPEYGIGTTPVGILTLDLPASNASYDVAVSARIVESTSGAPLAFLATPETGSIALRVMPQAPATPASSVPVLGILAALAILCLHRRCEP